MRRHLSAILSSCVLLACGGGGGGTDVPPPLDTCPGSDCAQNFVGSWDGSLAVTGNGRTSNNRVALPVSAAGVNKLSLNGLCTVTVTPTQATVLDAIEFSLDPVSCGPEPVGACASVTTHYDSGQGRLESGALRFSGTATLSGCGIVVPVTFAFSGIRSAAASAQVKADVEATWTAALAAAAQR
jgi:uncharacterized protein YceK